MVHMRVDEIRDTEGSERGSLARRFNKRARKESAQLRAALSMAVSAPGAATRCTIVKPHCSSQCSIPASTYKLVISTFLAKGAVDIEKCIHPNILYVNCV